MEEIRLSRDALNASLLQGFQPSAGLIPASSLPRPCVISYNLPYRNFSMVPHPKEISPDLWNCPSSFFSSPNFSVMKRTAFIKYLLCTSHFAKHLACIILLNFCDHSVSQILLFPFHRLGNQGSGTSGSFPKVKW